MKLDYKRLEQLSKQDLVMILAGIGGILELDIAEQVGDIAEKGSPTLKLYVEGYIQGCNNVMENMRETITTVIEDIYKERNV